MQAELERLGLSEDELGADFKAWRLGRIGEGLRSRELTLCFLD